MILVSLKASNAIQFMTSVAFPQDISEDLFQKLIGFCISEILEQFYSL